MRALKLTAPMPVRPPPSAPKVGEKIVGGHDRAFRSSSVSTIVCASAVLLSAPERP